MEGGGGGWRGRVERVEGDEGGGGWRGRRGGTHYSPEVRGHLHHFPRQFRPSNGSVVTMTTEKQDSAIGVLMWYWPTASVWQLSW